MSPIRAPALLFVRHGQTEPNLLHVRCGGDVDVPLTPRGVAQAEEVAARIAALHPEIDAIYASPLERTRQTAAPIAAALGVPVRLLGGLTERRLGAWNGRPVAETRAAIAAGETPPGGEAELEFRARVAGALLQVLEAEHRCPLLVSSRGVARVLGLLLGAEETGPADNGELRVFSVPERRE